MISKKKELRAKLLANKKESSLLRKELDSLDKLSERAIEIRKLLGIATMQDILGDRYPIRICIHCGKRAYTKDDLWDFQYNKASKHNHNNCCVDCAKLRALDSSINIVGPYSLLVLPKRCAICNRVEIGIGSRSWFIQNAVVCKSCLGTHEDMFGYPMKLKEVKPLVYQETSITSYTQLANLLELSYQKTRYLLLQNQIKGITWNH